MENEKTKYRGKYTQNYPTERKDYGKEQRKPPAERGRPLGTAGTAGTIGMQREKDQPDEGGEEQIDEALRRDTEGKGEPRAA